MLIKSETLKLPKHGHLKIFQLSTDILKLYIFEYVWKSSGMSAPLQGFKSYFFNWMDAKDKNTNSISISLQALPSNGIRPEFTDTLTYLVCCILRIIRLYSIT